MDRFKTNVNCETIDNVHHSAEDDTAHLPTITTTDGVLHLREAIALEPTVSDHLAVDGLHHTTSTMTEAMLEGLPQESMAHHHQEDMMTRTTPEGRHPLHEATTRTLGQIHMLDRAAHLLLEGMAATAAAEEVAIEVSTIGHTRYVRLYPTRMNSPNMLLAEWSRTVKADMA